MISDIDRQDILESLLADEDPDSSDPRWRDLVAGDDLYWIVALGINRLVQDPTNKDWIQLIGAAIRQSLPQLTPFDLDQDLAVLAPRLRENEISDPDMRWYWLLAELQEKYDAPSDAPKRQWPAPQDLASHVVLAVHEAVNATSSPDTFRQQVEVLLPTYPWLRIALGYHRVNFAINASRDQVPDDLAAHLMSLSEFARRRFFRIESVVQRRAYYGSPKLEGGTVSCEFLVPLSSEDTWQLILNERSLGSIQLRREPTGTVRVIEATGAWPACVPADGCWKIRRAAESTARASHGLLGRRGTPKIVPEPNERAVMLTIIWPSKGIQNG